MSDEATGPEIEALLTRYIERRLAGEGAPDLVQLARDAPELAPALRTLVERYESLAGQLTLSRPHPDHDAAPEVAPLPTFDGFRTIERLGRGGGGEVYKLLDLTLGRIVAGKVLRADGPRRHSRVGRPA